MTKPVRSITIEFERMPGYDDPVTMAFELCRRDLFYYGLRDIILLTFTSPGEYEAEGFAICHPKDEFDLEIGMLRAAKDLEVMTRSGITIYRAFRRWMWLAKAAHECRKHDCHAFYGPQSLAAPADKIAREFGRVTVTIA